MEASAISYWGDCIDDGGVRVAGAQEIGVHGMARLVSISGFAGGGDGLSDHLAAIDPVPTRVQGLAFKLIRALLFQGEQMSKVVGLVRHGGALFLKVLLVWFGLPPCKKLVSMLDLIGDSFKTELDQ